MPRFATSLALSVMLVGAGGLAPASRASEASETPATVAGEAKTPPRAPDAKAAPSKLEGPMAATVPQDPAAVSASVPLEQSDGSFKVLMVPRSSFPLAPTRTPSPAAEGPAASSHLDLQAAGRSPGFAPWSKLTTGISGTRRLPAVRRADYEARYRFEAERLLSRGRLEVQADLGERYGRRYVAKAGVSLETAHGWRAVFGDLGVPTGGPAIDGLTGRGLLLERKTRGTGSAKGLRMGLVGARTAVRYANVLTGSYPRKVAAGYVRLPVFAGGEMQAQAFRIEDSGGTSSVGAIPIRLGSGYGVSAFARSRHASIDTRWNESRLRSRDGALQDGAKLVCRARGDAGRLSAGADYETSQGAGYRPGALGALLPEPHSVLSGDLSVRLPLTWTVDAWAGRWEYLPVPVVLDPTSLETTPTAVDPAIRGSHEGGRIGCTLPWLGSGVSVSREVRRRQLETGAQQVHTTAVSLTQNLYHSLRLSVQANRFEQAGSASRQYLSGGLSAAMPGGVMLSFQQRSVWQEPLGARLQSVAELSSIRLAGSRSVWSVRLGQTHAQTRARLIPVETLGYLTGRLALARRLGLSVRCGFTWSAGHRVEVYELGISHTPDSRSESEPAVPSDPAAHTQQLLSGSVFEDRNGDGLRQDDEPGVPGVAVLVDNDIRSPLVTDLAGRYRALVAPGRHLVRLLPESVPTLFALEGTGTVEIFVSSEEFAEHDFPIARQVGTLQGRVVVQDTSEQPGLLPESTGRTVAGIKIVLDDGDFTITDDEGRFAFQALPAGVHEVSIDVATTPPGFQVNGPGAVRVQVDGDPSQPARCEFRLSRSVHQIRF
jgi:hypothetical protein